MAITALDGSQRQPLGVRDGSFSPDGAKLAYSLIDGGILIRDLATGEDLPVPGTANGDFNPIWSPDGAQIVFNRGMGIFDLFIVGTDGSDLRQITHGGVQEEWPVGWLEDGSFLYTVPGREYEYIVYRLDLASGEAGVLEREHQSLTRWPVRGYRQAGLLVSAGRSISAAWTALTAGRWPATACGF